MRTNTINLDLTEIEGITEDLQSQIKEAAEVSMGSEISTQDEHNIKELCTQIINLSEYRLSLTEYLKVRMMAIAPNLTYLVGELVAARLISHAGSLINLAKQPASTIQIFGAEKALFRALKTKHDTPKYGLIYHASIVGQASPKLKGKISRSLAAKCALCVRVDALRDTSDGSLGIQNRASLEGRIKKLEIIASGGVIKKGSGQGKKIEKYVSNVNNNGTYNQSNDVEITNGTK
jgi:nucleolar protein 58